MKTIISTIILLSFFSATSQIKLNNYFKNTEIVNLTSEDVEILNNEDMNFSHITAMTYADELLIFSDPDPEYSLKIVDLQRKNVYKFGRKGNGSGELQRSASWASINTVSRKLFIDDFPNYYYEYSIDSLKVGNYTPLASSFKLSLNDNKFSGNTYCHGYIIGSTFNKRFGLYNIATKQMLGKFDYEKEGVMENQSRFVSHPLINKVAFLASHHESMGILNIKNGEIILSKELNWEQNTAKSVTEGKYSLVRHSKRGFIDATTSNKYIFALYSGKLYEDRHSYIRAITTDVIYVFDWEAKPIKKYKLDKEVRTLAVDEKNNILYAATYQDGIPKIIKYELR